MASGPGLTTSDLHAMGKTVVGGRVVDIATALAPAPRARPEFPNPHGSWCIDNVWTLAPRVAGIDTQPLESGNQRQIFALYTRRGCVVKSLSQFRRSQVALGIPDLFVFTPQQLVFAPGCFWHEVKKPNEPQPMTDEQIDFAFGCAAAKIPYVVGPASTALAFAQSIGLTETR